MALVSYCITLFDWCKCYLIFIYTGIKDVAFMCELFEGGAGTAIDIEDVPFTVVPQTERQELCSTTDAESNVMIWYINIMSHRTLLLLLILTAHLFNTTIIASTDAKCSVF